VRHATHKLLFATHKMSLNDT